MILHYNNVWCYCEGSDEEISEISHLLTYSVKGAQYSFAYKSGKWNGKKSFFHTTGKCFPTGLMSYVITKLKNIKFSLDDQRPDFSPVSLQPLNLYDYKKNKPLEDRDYQKKAIETAIEKERGIIRLSTRSGKSLIGVGITQQLNVPTLFLCHSKDLLGQTEEEYKNKAKIEAGVVGDGWWKPNFVTVGMVQTLASYLKTPEKKELAKEFLESRELAIFDEVHRASDTYQKVSRAMKNARYRIGLSATALISGKENKFQSMALTGPLIYEVKMEKLVEDKHIAKPRAYFVNLPSGRYIQGDWTGIYDSGIVYNKERNSVVCQIAMKMLSRGIGSLILIEKLEHGYELEGILRGQCKVAFVHGQHSANQREEAKLDIQSGQLDVLITSRIFNEGVNIPLLECVIVASGWKSPILSYQRYGRGITKTEKKDSTIIVDFIDNSHGLLYNHSVQRREICEKDKAFDLYDISLSEILEGKII